MQRLPLHAVAFGGCEFSQGQDRAQQTTAAFVDGLMGCAQVTHQRGRGVAWKLTSGGFGKGGKALALEAERDFESGETITMDFGPEKLDGDLLLNYGVMDDYVTRVFPGSRHVHVTSSPQPSRLPEHTECSALKDRSNH